MFEKILARLGIKGTSKGDISSAAAGSRENTLPVLGSNNKIHGSMIDPTGITAATTADLVTTSADITVNVSTATKIAAGTTVQSTLNQIVNDATGLCLLRARALGDIASEDRAVAFNTIKQTATDAYTGVVQLATSAEVLTGTDPSKSITPATLKARYLQLAGGTLTGPLVLNADPTVALGAATKQYVDSRISSDIITTINKTLWVDGVNGSDSTGAVGKINLPYLTLGAASSAASSGDLIVVRPGTYNENNLCKSTGINWYFEPGAVVNYTSGGTTTTPIFEIADSACNVYGYGVFKNSLASGVNRFVLKATGATTKYIFQCQSIESGGTPISSDSSATGIIQVFDYIKATDYGNVSGGSTALKLGSGNIQVMVGNEISSVASNGAAVQLGNGTMVTGAGAVHTIKANRISAAGSAIYVYGASNSIVDANSIATVSGYAAIQSVKGNATIIANRISGDSSTRVIALLGGALTIKNALIYNMGSGNTPIHYQCTYDAGDPNNADYPYLILNNCEVITRDTALAASTTDSHYKLRVMGYCQSDCADPTAVITRAGGVWETVTFPTNYPY